jgi:hypothetical protein
MTRYLALVVALAACGPKAERVDSTDAALPAIDTLKPVTASDTARIDSTRSTIGAAPTGATTTKSTTPTVKAAPTKAGRDSAFPPPRGLPKLDTVPTKRPPR